MLDSHTRFSEEELHRLNQTSLALKDGGYIGELGVYHELHCVVGDRQCTRETFFKIFD